MKPDHVFLIVKKEIGLKIIRIFPDFFFKRKLKDLPKVCLPFGVMEGDFISSEINNYFFASYIFLIPSNEEAMLASLTAVYKKNDFDPEKVKSYFKKVIATLRENKKGDLAFIANSLPKIYQNHLNKKISLKSTITTVIQINSDENKQVEKNNALEEATKRVDEDLWFDDEDDEINSENEETEVSVEYKKK